LARVATGLNISACPNSSTWTTRAIIAYRRAMRSRSNAPTRLNVKRTSEGWTQFNSVDRGVFVHVSPFGSDFSQTASAKAPLQTLQAAKAYVRGLLARQRASQSQQPITVTLHEGTYYEPLVLGPEDSGCGPLPSGVELPEGHRVDRGACAVSWQARAGERAVVSGGKPVVCNGSWRSSSINGHTAYSCNLTSDFPSFQSMFYNDVRLQRARWPNGDPAVPCNSESGCAAAGYTTAGQASSTVGGCPRNANPVTGGPTVRLQSSRGETLSMGIVGLDRRETAL